MQAQRDLAHESLITALDSTRCGELHDRLLDAVADPRTAPQADDPAEENIPALMGRPWRKLKQAVDQCGPEPSDADFHAIRIKAKRCRYAAEAVEPVLGKPARRMAKAMRRLQDALGDLNDATVIRGHLATTVARHGEVGFVAGELSGLLIARAGHCATDFERLWEETEGLELPAQRPR
jgi:CHAD domain-containing protein